MRKFYCLFVGLIFCLGFNSHGQNLSAKWKKNPVRIGDHAELKIVLDDAPKDLKFEPQTGEIECDWKQSNENLWKVDGVLEILSFKDTLIKKGKKYRWEATYELIAWDSAYYRFPDINITIKDSGLSVQAPILKVGFLKKKINLDIDEIKVEPEFENPILIFIKKWWWVLFGILAFILAIYIWNKRTRLKKYEFVSIKKRYLNEVKSLQKRELWKEQTDNHYLEFTAILKRFLTEIYQVNLTSKTSKETILLLNAKGIDPSVVVRIRGLLNEADLVKFAKSTSKDDLIINGMKRLEELIVELSPIETING